MGNKRQYQPLPPAPEPATLVLGPRGCGNCITCFVEEQSDWQGKRAVCLSCGQQRDYLVPEAVA